MAAFYVWAGGAAANTLDSTLTRLGSYIEYRFDLTRRFRVVSSPLPLTRSRRRGRVKEDAQDEAWLGEVSSEQVIQCTMVQQQLNSTFPTLNPRSAKAKLLAYKYFKDVRKP